LERKRSINGFHKQANLVERTWNDDLRAMSYGVGSAVVLLVTDQNLILQTAFHGWNVANARPASGQAAATPPSSVMHSRRFMSAMGLPPSGADTGHDSSKRPPRPRPSGGRPQKTRRPLVRQPRGMRRKKLAGSTAPVGFPSCMSRVRFPSPAPSPTSGGLWLHEIKHDGFRVIARKDGDRVRLYSRPGTIRR
jgi:hypothetical protein